MVKHFTFMMVCEAVQSIELRSKIRILINHVLKRKAFAQIIKQNKISFALSILKNFHRYFLQHIITDITVQRL